MRDQKPPAVAHEGGSMSRREFTALSLAAGIAAALPAHATTAPMAVRETDVEVRTPSGSCDAALAQPVNAGRWPAVIIFPDIWGLRPATREMAKRLAADGYAVLVPNPFYRAAKSPVLGPEFDFQSPTDRARLTALRAPLTTEGVASDATAYAAFLDAQAAVDPKARIGVVGYCMGGPMTMQAAAALPGRVGAGASFHGGGLVTDKPDSPHLLVPKMRAQYYFGIAANDDEREPQSKTALAEAFRAAHLDAKVEVYPGTLHGWCMSDMPLQGGKPIYNEAQAERAWAEMRALFRRALV